MIGEFTTMAVVDVLSRIGIYNPPQWLVDAILVASVISIIITLLAGIGWVTVPLWAARALLAADTAAV